MKKRSVAFFVLTLLLSTLTLSSCSGGLYTSLMTLLGFDMNDYESETVKRIITESDDAFDEIVSCISIIVYDSSEITPFESTREAASGNRDAILNYMLRTSYAAYSGNSELLLNAEKEYPQYNITILIPKSDFESYVYRSLGGDSSVVHESTVRFTYLQKVDAYTTTGQPIPLDVDIGIKNCCETEHTYRVEFTLTAEDGVREYSTMIMKRDDGTLYMKYLRRVNEEE